MGISENIIGVDLGGTNIRAGRVVENKIVQFSKERTPSNGTKQEVINSIFSAIDQCINSGTVGIGIGVPAVVDVEKGIVYDVTNIPSWNEVPLKEILQNKYQVPVSVNNDANCFIVGEKFFGKGKLYNSIVGLALGTGLGCGLIFNGQLYEGRNCGAGEFGIIPYLDYNFEYYCSGQFFKKEKGIDAELAYIEAKAGNIIYANYFREFGFHLGQVIKSMLYAYDPEIIIIGGSLTKAYELYKEAMFAAMQDLEFSNTLKRIKIEISELDNSAIFGAAGLFINQSNIINRAETLSVINTQVT
jgi:glucokinase